MTETIEVFKTGSRDVRDLRGWSGLGCVEFERLGCPRAGAV